MVPTCGKNAGRRNETSVSSFCPAFSPLFVY